MHVTRFFNEGRWLSLTSKQVGRAAGIVGIVHFDFASGHPYIRWPGMRMPPAESARFADDGRHSNSVS
jgi:hypothetical protein